MSKIFKLTISLFIMFGLCVFVLNINNVKANTINYVNKNKTAEWNISSEISTNVNGMTYTEIKGESKSSQGTGCQTFGNQTISLLEMKTDGVNSKLVCWGIQQGTTGVNKSPLTTIAKDYEKKHPGWIVVGGVNGDQYFMNYGTGISSDGSWLYTPTACYPLMIDNEVRYPISPIGVKDNYRGILNNGQANSLAAESDIAGVRVELIDENNNIISWYDVDKINEKPNAGEVTVWSSYISNKSSAQYVEFDVTTNSNLYIVENPELAYMPSSSAYNELLKDVQPGINFPDVIFGRGAISVINKEYHFGGNKNKQAEYAKVNAFGIETDNPELQAKLTMGTRIRVEYYYTSDELNNCEYFLNYHSIQRENGQDVYSEQPYDLQRYSRSVWGRKADGTYILLTSAMYTGEGVGTSQAETNAILERYGVVDAYQQDGGGSAMCIVRNFEKGSFDIVQHSRDGKAPSQRSVAYGCFFVIRDPGIDVNTKNTTYHSCELTYRADFDHSIFSNYQVKVNGTTYNFDETNHNVVIDNLKPGTSYKYELTYTINESGKTSTGSYSGTITTDEYPYPTEVISLESRTKNSITFKKLTNNVTNLKIIFDDADYEFKDELLFINKLEKDTEYQYKYEYDIYNEYTKDTMHYESIQKTTKTLSKSLPKINSFTEVSKTSNSVTLNVDYEDEDKLITSIYIISGNDIIDITSSGDITISELLASTEYSFKVICEYNDETIESDTLTITTLDEVKKSGCNKNTIYIYLSVLLGIVIFVKKKH